MNRKGKIAFVVEGASTEKNILKNMRRVFFNERRGFIDSEIIILPGELNIYMLWDIMRKEDFDVDIIEIIKERILDLRGEEKNYDRNEFSEVYLFFDLDAHQQNLPRDIEISQEEVVKCMLDTFDNETENGKLYINYPMCEAIRDCVDNSCVAFNGECYVDYRVANYKEITAFYEEIANPMNHISRYTDNKWEMVFEVYIKRLSCLNNSQNVYGIEMCKKMTPAEIYKIQQKSAEERGKILVLSAFPEFLIDYFKNEDLLDFIKVGNSEKLVCEKEQQL